MVLLSSDNGFGRWGPYEGGEINDRRHIRGLFLWQSRHTNKLYSKYSTDAIKMHVQPGGFGPRWALQYLGPGLLLLPLVPAHSATDCRAASVVCLTLGLHRIQTFRSSK